MIINAEYGLGSDADMGRTISCVFSASPYQQISIQWSAAIHVAVADAPPLMRGTLLFEHLAAIVDPGRAHEAREVEIVG